MSQELFNNILAVIGAVSGLIGLLMSLFLLSKEKIKLEVFHPNEERTALVGFNQIPIGNNSFGEIKYKSTPYLLLIWLQITNKSKNPTTILEMSLKLPGNKESILYSQTSEDYSIASTYLTDNQGNITIKSSWHFKDIVKPPVAIEAFSTVEGYFFFRDLNIAEEEVFTGELSIKTPQKKSKHLIKIKPQYPTKLPN